MANARASIAAARVDYVVSLLRIAGVLFYELSFYEFLIFLAGMDLYANRALGKNYTIRDKMEQCFQLATTIRDAESVADMCISLQSKFKTETIADYRIPNWETEPLHTLARLEGGAILLLRQKKLTWIFRKNVKKYNELMNKKVFESIALESAEQIRGTDVFELHSILDEILPSIESKYIDLCARIVSGDVTVAEAAKWSALNKEIGELFPTNAHSTIKDRFSRVDNLLNNVELAKQLIKLSKTYGIKSLEKIPAELQGFSVS